MIKILALSSFFFMGVLTASNAQPAWSRGIQIIQVNHGDCMQRAESALQAEGYYIQNRGGDFVAGQKGIHSAVITCNATSDGRSYVNIFVASTSNDPGVPGNERVRLQARIDNSSPVSKTIQGNWSTQPNGLGGKVGQRFTIYIPPGGTASGRIWGSDIYTDDSSIGTCAVHAGLITFQNGGTVTIEIRQGLSSYQSTTRNGITSNAYGSWGRKFCFCTIVQFYFTCLIQIVIL